MLRKTFGQNLRHRLYRASFPKAFRHHATLDRRLGVIHDRSCPVQRCITWCGREVGVAGDLGELQNVQRGDCFIVCSGPSLNDVDLSLLSGRRSFAVNGSIVAFESCGIKPDYYTATDPDFFQHRMPMVEQAISSGADCFFSLEVLPWLIRHVPEHLRATRIFLVDAVNRRFGQPRLSAAAFRRHAATDADLLLHPSHPDHTGSIGFSTNLCKGLFCGRTVAFRALQIAYHLGFRRLFLLGMDLGGDGQQIRCYHEQLQQRPSRLADDYQRYILPSFEILSSHSSALGLEVYNVSSGSRLPASVIPKISLNRALQMTEQSRVA